MARNDQVMDDPLVHYLDDEAAVNNTMSKIPRDALLDTGRRQLRRLYFHYCQDDDTLSSDPEHDHIEEHNHFPSRQAKSKSKFRGFPEINRFKKITALSLPQTVLKYIEKWETDPRAFMDCKMLVHGSTSWPDNAGDTFVHYYKYTKELIAEECQRNVQYLFQMLNYHDIGELVMTTKGMGHRQLVTIENFLETIQVNATGINSTVAARNVVEWWAIGSKINILCKVFGPGCIFFLSKELSDDFLKTKLRASGAKYEELIYHLQHVLHLEALLEQTGAGELGINLRARLIEPFQKAAEVFTPQIRGPKRRRQD